MLSFSKVGIIGRQGSPHIVDSLNAVYRVLSDRGCDVTVESESAELFNVSTKVVVERANMKDRELLAVVGGDGSILGVARDFAELGIPLMGVNRGGLGFLADIQPEQIESSLENILAGEYRREDHFLIEQRVLREGREIHRSLALNDVVVSSGTLSRMLDFTLTIDDDFVYEIRADGILISTPTGSTAYSLSAGGAILHPKLDALSVIPLYPHTLTSRQIAVPGDFVIEVEVSGGAPVAHTSADSQIEFGLLPGDKVAIRKYPHQIPIVYAATHSFYEACRSKLDWGTRLGPKQN